MTVDAISAEPETPADPPAPRKPRKVFLLVGVILAAALGVGLFTSVGTRDTPTSGPPHDGGKVPSFSGRNLNGPGTVSVSDSGTGGVPEVLLFFGNWCPACHQELPPLAAAVRKQVTAGGSLAKVRVVGVDSEDTVAAADGFIHSSGVTFPVAYDRELGITSGLFYFRGDPDAVFVNGDGTIARIVRGEQLTPATFAADERALTPSGT
jgi:cytochrome c biogenesis protein CcmG, thiol:disulfide interchange protein DsbE